MARTLDSLCVNTIRTLSIDAVQEANSGHPGLPMGAAPMAYVLWSRHLRHDPSDPEWPDRDRFVLSAGHGSMLQYALLHLFGYDLSLEDLKSFRQRGSRTPGHPEFRDTPGVEATTGPLGQGTANALGMAIAERALAHRFNRPGHEIVDHWTYALLGDGCLMEGISAEAASLAGHLKLGKLIYLYDSNDVSLDGPTSMAFTEDVGARYEAYGWQVLRVEDGDDDLDAIDRAITEAKADTERPSLIVVRTTIGFGSPNKAGRSAAHGSPLGDDEVALAKKAYGWPSPEKFHVPAEAREHFGTFYERGRALSAEWKRRCAAWADENAELAREWSRRAKGELPEGWDADLPTFTAGEKAATRSVGGKVLTALAGKLPEILGGDADLSGSTKTALAGEDNFDGQSGAGRNLRFGVREHAMGAIANGMAYHGGFVPYTATFFVFADYMRPAVRLAALSRLQVVFVWTHDSVLLGEDGPTHQPVEQLASLRAIPDLAVFRPADANETLQAWRAALLRSGGPSALVLSRQGLPVLEETERLAPEGVARGAYVLSDSGGGAPEAILIATGSEVSLALEAQAVLAGEGRAVRVVSMPCWDLFAEQDAAYRDSVLPPAVEARVAVEAACSFGWERWVGSGGACVTIDRFGASAPEAENRKTFGLTPENVSAVVRSLLD